MFAAASCRRPTLPSFPKMRTFSRARSDAGGINRALVIDDGTLEGSSRSLASSGSSRGRKPGALTFIPWSLIVSPAHEQRRRYAT